MELVARELAAFVTDHVDLPAATGPRHAVEQQEVTATGDTAAMLDLPDGQQLYPPEQVLLRRVVTDDGSAWRSDQRADVLVLGDSFSNIYSLASMGWGDSAGLVEHLSFALARPVDRIVQNADAAFATRELLARAGAGRLSGKRVVIWQFSVRELAFGDWKLIQFP
jgi:alginate O-acetyltransferase complex protein AlgJ